jgi:hypothetical protein
MGRRGQTKIERTDSVDGYFFESLIITQQIKKLPTFMKPEAPLPCAQIDRILSQMNPAHIFRHYFCYDPF